MFGGREMRIMRREGGRDARKLPFVTTSALPDASTPLGEKVRRRLRDEPVAWLTTVARDGTPQPNPVWFLWEDDSILVYNRSGARRLAHVRERPAVSLNFDSGGGGDIVVITGRAELAEGEPAPHQHPGYLAKYERAMSRVSGSPEAFGRAYPVPLRIRPVRFRGF
jgi:PPOX class probable F420-dependent enzyme